MKTIIHIILSFCFLLYSCQKEKKEDPSIAIYRKTAEYLISQNQSKINEIQNDIAERGFKQNEVKIFDNIKDLLESNAQGLFSKESLIKHNQLLTKKASDFKKHLPKEYNRNEYNTFYKNLKAQYIDIEALQALEIETTTASSKAYWEYFVNTLYLEKTIIETYAYAIGSICGGWFEEAVVFKNKNVIRLGETYTLAITPTATAKCSTKEFNFSIDTTAYPNKLIIKKHQYESICIYEIEALEKGDYILNGWFYSKSEGDESISKIAQFFTDSFSVY